MNALVIKNMERMNEYTGERKCDECIFHASGQCSKWNCEFIGVKEAENAVKKIRKVEAQDEVNWAIGG
jgi:hypothetical protein